MCCSGKYDEIEKIGNADVGQIEKDMDELNDYMDIKCKTQRIQLEI